MKRLIIGLILVVLLLVPVSCTSTLPVSEEEEEAPFVELEQWQIGEHWQYSPQAVWDDAFVGVEYIFGDGLETQYISTYNLHTRKKERLLSFDPEIFRVSPPSISENRIIWSAANISGKQLSEIDWDELNWDIFLFNLETGEVQQITTDEHAQTEPRVYGDTIVWLDDRHGTGERYPYPPPLDVYAYDLNTGEEKRLTSATTVEGYDHLSISGNLVVWTDSRYADPSVKSHPSNDPDYNNEIYVYDLTTKEERRVTDYPGNDNYPAIDGNRVVWLRQSDYLQADIFVFDLKSGQETKVSSSGYAAYSPSICGDLVVWSDAGVSKGNTSGDVVINDVSGAAEIYLYDLYTELETLLVPSETEGEYKDVIFRQVWLNPVIHGDFVVYTLSRMVGPIVYAMKLDDK